MEKETGSLAIQTAKRTHKLKGKKTWVKSPIICSGRLESFQRRKVTEILRDCYHRIDPTYWPNALNLIQLNHLYASHEGHEKLKPLSPPAIVQVNVSYQKPCILKVREGLRF